jgi:hypothetical protein
MHGISVMIRCGNTLAKKPPWLRGSLSMRKIKEWKAALYSKKGRKKTTKKQN